MKKQSNHKAIANGIEYQLQLRGRFYAVCFTDPRSHQRQRIPTKCSNQTAAHAFAANYLQKYVPGESGKLTVGQLVENFLAHQEVKLAIVRDRTADAREESAGLAEINRALIDQS